MMEEVLTKAIAPDTPLKEQDSYLLSLLDEANDLGTRHCVRLNHMAWNEAGGDFLSNHEEIEYFWILAEAKARYYQRRQSLVEMGYISSDMDLF